MRWRCDSFRLGVKATNSKAKAKALTSKAKAKAKDLASKAKAKDLTAKAMQRLGPSPTYKVKAKEGIHSTLHHTHYSRII